MKENQLRCHVSIRFIDNLVGAYFLGHSVVCSLTRARSLISRQVSLMMLTLQKTDAIADTVSR